MSKIDKCIEELKRLVGLTQTQLEEVQRIVEDATKSTIASYEFKDIPDLIANLYDFKGDWKRINELHFDNYKSKSIYVYCLYISGESCRKVTIHPQNTSPYYFVDVKFKTESNPNDFLTQSVCAWHTEELDYSPFRNKDHKNIWRKFNVDNWYETHRILVKS
jgi:hypothetical protein